MIEHFNAAWSELTSPGAPFSMTEIEVRGVPIRVFDNAPPTMRSLWELATLHGDRTYVVFEDERYTYAEIAAQVRALAHHLRDEHGVGTGDRVAIAMRNYPEWVVGYWATVSIGAAVVGMNAWWTSQEMAFGLADSRPKVLIADDERLERVVPELDALRSSAPLHVIAVRSERDLPGGASRWTDVVDPAGAPDGLPDAEIDPDDDATIFYTSGTTGNPKGAQLTHRGSVHNVMNLAFMTTVSTMAEGRAAAAAAAAADPADHVPDESAPAAESSPPVFMAPTPLFHVTANNCLLQPCTIAGGTIVFMHKWDARRALELIERERVTNFSGVPTMSREMLMHPDWETRDTSSVKGMGGGGAPIQPDLVDKIDKSLRGGVPATGYGLTETHGIVTANQAKLYTEKPASCGRIVPTLDGRLEDAAGDVVEGPDAVGELCVRGAVVIKGYLNRPDATAEAIVDGWFHTGDIAYLDDDGFVHIVDRIKDMVLRGGENIYCSEVEAAVYDHPSVAEAAVFGVPDERLGETVGVAIHIAAGATLTEQELKTYLEPRLA
ncbi:MAG: AMP-binding protein, partial [Ilumatobacter sp.]|nr:AMP-binding protein [Ilumatobacter sp.]